MKIGTPLSILLSIAAFALLVMTFTNLLSGYMDDRTCQTDCVWNYYLGAFGLGALALLSALAGWVAARKKGFATFAVLLALPVPAVTGGIFAIGTILS